MYKKELDNIVYLGYKMQIALNETICPTVY